MQTVGVVRFAFLRTIIYCLPRLTREPGAGGIAQRVPPIHARRTAQRASLLRPCELNSCIALPHAQFRAGTGDNLAGTVDKLGLCQRRPLILFDEAGGSRQRS